MFLVIVSGREIADEVPARALRLIKTVSSCVFYRMVINGLPTDKCNPISLTTFGNAFLAEYIGKEVANNPRVTTGGTPNSQLLAQGEKILYKIHPYYRKLSTKHKEDYKTIGGFLCSGLPFIFLATTSYAGRTKFAIDVSKAYSTPHIRLDLPDVDAKLDRMEKYLERRSKYTVGEAIKPNGVPF
jgi:hypothetical protein